MRSRKMLVAMYNINKELKSEKDRHSAGELANIVAMYEYAHNVSNHRRAS
jgi:hypothetical protein